MGPKSILEKKRIAVVNPPVYGDIGAIGGPIHLFYFACRQLWVLAVNRLGRFYYVNRAGRIPLHRTPIRGGIEFPVDVL